MTIYGPDISSFQRGVDISRLTDPFVMLKCTEGTYYADAYYAGWLSQAQISKKLVVAYHFLKAEEPAEEQARWMRSHIVDASLPVMLDVETEGSSRPDLPMVLRTIDAMQAVGLSVRLVYLPRWYWQQVGSPDLTPLAARGVGVVSSAYPSGGRQDPVGGYLASGGNAGAGWASYGGVTPILWQYTDSGLEQQPLDFNAFRGTIEELAAFLRGQQTPEGGEVMGTYTVGDGWQRDYPDVASALQQHIPAGSTVDEVNAAAYAMIRSFVAAERAAVIESKLDQLLSRQSPAVDVAAVANQVTAGIMEHLASGADVQAVAVAVQQHLAQALSAH
jgi:hypothetical protein